MFTSLRSRLGLTYMLASGVTLLVIAAGVAIYLIRNPFFYQETAQRMRIADEIVSERLGSLPPGGNTGDLLALLQRTDDALSTRVLVLNMSGQVLANSRAGSAPGFVRLTIPSGLSTQTSSRILAARDDTGRVWIYVLRQIDSNELLMVAAPRPALQILSILNGELVRPILEAGLVALLLAILLAFVMARWIAAPLQRMASASQAVAAGKYHTLPLEGPREEKALAASFNEMTRKVEASQQSQRDFVANVSHELKTPLTSIQGFAQAILDGTASSPQELRQAAEVIHTEANRMNRMVLDLLALARLEGGTADLQQAPIDLAALLRAVLEKFSPQARECQVELRAEVGDLPEVAGDADRLTQVFTNLVDNALKFTPAGGKVLLSAGRELGQAVVSVADTGRGMPSEVKERIFERFYQVDRSRQGGAGRGAGLGLAIAREIVAAHGGTISVESVLGRGSTFVVRLPAGSPVDSTLVKRRA